MAKTLKKTAGRARLVWRKPINLLALAACLVAAAPAAAESLFEKLYPASNGQVRLPTPFAALLDDIRAKTGNAEIEVAFFPLGRSLQRLAADPDFLAKPRIVAAVTRDGTSAERVGDRLFLGHQAVSQSVEIISFDDAEGRFVFQEVTDYGPGRSGTLHTLPDESCNVCHQGNVPVFAASPWSESNANPAVVAALPLSYEGLAISKNFDGVDQFDQSVRRASQLRAAAALWTTGCKTRACRASLLAEVLRYRLSTQPLAHEIKDASFATEVALNWPEGFGLPPAKIADHDPMALLDAGATPVTAMETAGVFNPETPRASQTVWPAGPLGPQMAVQLASELVGQRDIEKLAAQLTPHDPDWLAQRIRDVAAGDARAEIFYGAVPTPSSLEALFARVFSLKPKSGDNAL